MARVTRTLVELATELGLSKTTVADALRGSGRVSEATRARVRQAALESGYVSNKSARQLRTRTSETIGLYIAPDVRNMPFYMPFAFGVTEAASTREHDVTLIARSSASTTESWDHLDGAIVIDTTAQDSVVASLVHSNIPVVSAGRVDGIVAERFSAVIEIEHARACADALDILWDRGVRRPALVAPDARGVHSWAQLLRDGYQQWCSEHGVEPFVVSLPPFPTNRQLEIEFDRFISDPSIDAVFFGWREIADRGLIFFDRSETSGRSRIRVATATSNPTIGPLHSFDVEVDLRPHEFGRAAADLLLSHVAEPGFSTTHVFHRAEVVSAPI
ncbi:LacI family DNA-binding transcriptional regulator [Rhodococcus sp. 1R11]|uniref:LacI family DNA-binding transcriptional regulator n=1 Tax=Rhodococcus sp. 1R11 TaxID=2559614 RepID=UPI001430B97E|nr:LacI family DNA-binding transcriptional regulator [Rhodococcus sp. 1R11]